MVCIHVYRYREKLSFKMKEHNIHKEGHCIMHDDFASGEVSTGNYQRRKFWPRTASIINLRSICHCSCCFCVKTNDNLTQPSDKLMLSLTDSWHRLNTYTRFTYNRLDLSFSILKVFLRMYCIDTLGVPESSNAGTFYCLYPINS